MDVGGVFNGLLDNGNVLDPIGCTFGEHNADATVIDHEPTRPGGKIFPCGIRNGQGIDVSRFRIGLFIIGRIVDEGERGTGGVGSQWNPNRIQSGPVGEGVQGAVQDHFLDAERWHILRNSGIFYIKKANDQKRCVPVDTDIILFTGRKIDEQ